MNLNGTSQFSVFKCFLVTRGNFDHELQRLHFISCYNKVYCAAVSLSTKVCNLGSPSDKDCLGLIIILEDLSE